jgi:hypothetical protein
MLGLAAHESRYGYLKSTNIGSGTQPTTAEGAVASL